jgi:hypothetical protein
LPQGNRKAEKRSPEDQWRGWCRIKERRMGNWDLSLIAGLLGLAAIVYLIERQTNRSNAVLKTILAQTERSNALLTDIHKLAEAKLNLIADPQERISPALASESKESPKGALLEMTEVLKETSSANGTQLRLIREELSELISEMRAILLIVRPD